MRTLAGFLTAAALLILPATAYAQASVTGLVRDTSGAVLPGVTVEAASPALIEKVRTVVTDGSGQYRLVDLRPGVYTVTFTLAGFNSVKREGIELTGSFIATVNADMRVGALEETITVTGEAPIVDVQNAKQQQVMDRDLIASIPTARQYFSLAVLVPGMTVSGASRDVGGSATIGQPDYTIHGGRPGDGRILVDGLSVGAPQVNGSNRTMYNANVGNTQETAFSTSGGLGESETAGVVINMVPREGGNTIRGTFFSTYANGALQSSNFSDELRARGLRTPNEVKSVWEVSPTIGGPVVQDRLWYFATARHQGTRNYLGGIFHNRNEGDLSKWTYEPDTARRAIDDGTWKSASLRLTMQVTPRNKVNVFWDEQTRCVMCIGGGSTPATAFILQSPEATARQEAYPNRVRQITWTSPVTSRVLLEAGWGGYHARWGQKEREGYNRQLTRVLEQAGVVGPDRTVQTPAGLFYRAPNGWQSNWSGTSTWRAALSYVTGSNTMKVGYYGGYFDRDNNLFDPNPITYVVANRVPIALSLSGAPLRVITAIEPMALYAQDSWVRGRFTLQGGVRYDHQTQHFPEQTVGFSRFIPNGFVVPEGDGMNFSDITPRMAVTFDPLGRGRTAIKVTAGKYVLAQDGAGIFGNDLNPVARLATAVNRAWTDTNGNFVADCDLLNPNAQSPATTGSIDTCGPFSDRNFGRNVYSSTYDPALIEGWGVRPYQWEFGTTVQHELLPRVSVNGGFFRRIYGNFVVVDNRAVTAADFDTFTLAVPSDSRLPSAGQTLQVVNVTPARFGILDNFVTRASNYGEQKEHWNGFDLSVNVRGRGGLSLSGGLSSGKTSVNNCDIVDDLPEMLLGVGSNPTILGIANNGVWIPRQFCDQESPFVTHFTGFASYTVPKIDVLISGTVQSIPGSPLAANYNAPNAVVAAALGRPLAGNAATLAVNVLEPGALYGDRTNQLDMRFAKVLRISGRRVQVGMDLYNAFNANPIQTYLQTLGVSWLAPTSILPARFAKFSAQLDF